MPKSEKLAIQHFSTISRLVYEHYCKVVGISKGFGFFFVFRKLWLQIKCCIYIFEVLLQTLPSSSRAFVTFWTTKMRAKQNVGYFFFKSKTKPLQKLSSQSTHMWVRRWKIWNTENSGIFLIWSLMSIFSTRKPPFLWMRCVCPSPCSCF